MRTDKVRIISGLFNVETDIGSELIRLGGVADICAVAGDGVCAGVDRQITKTPLQAKKGRPVGFQRAGLRSEEGIGLAVQDVAGWSVQVGKQRFFAGFPDIVAVITPGEELHLRGKFAVIRTVGVIAGSLFRAG